MNYSGNKNCFKSKFCLSRKSGEVFSFNFFHSRNLIRSTIARFHITYKLADIEKMFGIRRNRTEYKKSIFEIWNDWHRPARRERILEYNQEDVINLIKLWKIIREEYQIDDEYLLKNRLL